MINKEEIIQFMREGAYKPLNVEELLDALQVEQANREEFRTLLNEMEKKGKIVKTRVGTYGVPERMNLVVGTLQGNPRGFGFVIPDNPDEPDIFIASGDMGGAMHNDRVIARKHKISTAGKSIEGEIIRILERANKTVVGSFERTKAFGFVVPDEQRITHDVYIAPEDAGRAKDGDKVVVEIIKWPEKRKSPEGKVIEILGKTGDPGVDITAIVRKYQLPEDFPLRVTEEAERIPEEVPEGEIAQRRDLRDLNIITIDGEDAKDLDDAVSLEKLTDGKWRLGVHIADVSYYVKEKSKLDLEAMNRGTSVYLVDRVIPMLPKILSNGVCSLHPRVNRLTLSCFMDFDEKGSLLYHEFAQTVIRTKHRMTYGEVNKILNEQDPELITKYQDVYPMLQDMGDLAAILRKKREERGAIDFEFLESKVILDAQGKPVEIKKRERSTAERLIEEFMLAANETVAEHFYWMELPFVYRVHEEPDADDIVELNKFLHNFGYHIRGMKNLHPKSLQEILQKVEGRPEERVVNTAILRSLTRARYATESLGHFGLAAKFYTHFTSPIRRYPDLWVHRLMREYLFGGKSISKERMEYLKDYLVTAMHLASTKERIAEEAERESVDLKKIEFMADKVGEVYEGIISGVTSFGIFVELDNTVEGLIHVSNMTDDYYHYDEKTFSLTGERRKRRFQIGDRVKIKVARANMEERKLDFLLADDGEEI